MKKVILKLVLVCSVFGVFLITGRAEAASKTYRIGTSICVDKNGRAVCKPDYNAIINQTGRVIVNGWVNYGPWQPRPGFGVIVP